MSQAVSGRYAGRAVPSRPGTSVGAVYAFPNMGAGPPEHAELRLGNLRMSPGLVLAPMAGYTNAPFRAMCRRSGATLCISELVIAASLVKREKRSMELARFIEDEYPKSVQLYGTDPVALKKAVQMLTSDMGVHHVDLNFGCPVRKITSKGGGSAIPLRPKLFLSLVAAAVQGASGVPVTVKLRIGVSDQLLTYMEAGALAQDAGAAGVTLHARTADQMYWPPVRWGAVRELSDALTVPVIGNGDVRCGADAVSLMQQSGCQGVMVGRACLGRPWVFAELAAAMRGLPAPPAPRLQAVVSLAHEHTWSLADWTGDERRAAWEMRSLVPLYLLGFASAEGLRRRLLAAECLEDWHSALREEDWDPEEPFPPSAERAVRLKGGGPPRRQKVTLPADWLAHRDDELAPSYLRDEACEG